jgi:phosphatidylglycerol:prolipoprotein diacylglycerol transferase
MTTVYPLKFQVGPLEITGFGLMMMAAFLAGGWLIARQFREQKLNEDYSGDIVFGAVIVSIIAQASGTWDWMDSLFSRGGLVWYGGFLGGCLGVTLASLRRGVPVRFTAQLVAPVLPAAYAIGRVGCFMVGDDYGVATTVPWGVKFPQGIPPTTAAGLAQFGFPVPAGRTRPTCSRCTRLQLYEVAIMTAVFMLLWHWRRRAGWGTGALRSLPGLRGTGALRGGIPAGQGRPVLRRAHPGAGHEPRDRGDRRVLVCPDAESWICRARHVPRYGWSKRVEVGGRESKSVALD